MGNRGVTMYAMVDAALFWMNQSFRRFISGAPKEQGTAGVQSGRNKGVDKFPNSVVIKGEAGIHPRQGASPSQGDWYQVTVDLLLLFSIFCAS